MKSIQGFTFIELMVVIAVIGILAAVLVPNLLAARMRAHDAVAIACADGFLKKAEMFQISNQTYVGFGTAIGSNSEYKASESCESPNNIKSLTIKTEDRNFISGEIVSLSNKTIKFNISDGITRN